MVFKEGDIDCVEELIKPAKRVIGERDSISYDPFEKRVSLWNRISENYDKYKDGVCGQFYPDLDSHFKSLFEISLLILADSFRNNGESFKAAERYTEKEIAAFKLIERYNYFEIYSINDIKKKVVAQDTSTLRLFKDFYVVDRWLSQVLEDPSFKRFVRYYLKEKWRAYKDKLNEAMGSLIIELDWFRNLVVQWEKEARAYAEEELERAIRSMRQELIDEVSTEIEKVKDMESQIAKKEEELKEKEKELDAREETIKKEIEELRLLKEKKEKGSRFVETGRAKQYELNFIGRMERKLTDEVKISGKSFKLEKLEEGREVDVSRYIGAKTKIGILREKDVKNIPENRYVVAKLVERKLIGSKERYTLKAIFASRVDRYVERGFDTDPLELSDVNAYMVDARDEAKQMGETIVLCLASPTGFEEAVRDHVSSDEFYRNFLSRYLSVILIDLDANRMFYNPNDDVAKEFAKICEMEIDKEKMARVERCVKSAIDEEVSIRGYAVLSDLTKCGDEAIVRAVFYRVAEENNWKVKYVDGVGLVVMV